jgi:hypothetical protein
VIIDTTVSIVAIFIFLLGVTQVFIWTNRSMIARQREYQATRTQLGNPYNAGAGDAAINFYEIDDQHSARRLYVFEQEQP